MTNLNKEREAFEAWWLREGSEVDLIRESSGAYAFTQAESSWDGWRARAALAGPGGLVVEAALASVEWLANNAKGISLTDWGVHSARILSALATPLAAPDCPCAALAPDKERPANGAERVIGEAEAIVRWTAPLSNHRELADGDRLTVFERDGKLFVQFSDEREG